MPSIKEIQRQLATFNKAASGSKSPEKLQIAWKRIFGKDLSHAAAKNFSQYYKEMRSNRSTRRSGANRLRKTSRARRAHGMRGGAAYTLPSTPVHYVMTPGVYTNTLAQTPVEVDTDPASLDALSGGVYPPNMSIPLSRPGFWPTVPTDMGSNKVGGRRPRSTRRNKQTQHGGVISSPESFKIGTPIYWYNEGKIYKFVITDINNEELILNNKYPVHMYGNSNVPSVFETREWSTQLTELKSAYPDAEVVSNPESNIPIPAGGRRRREHTRRRQCGGFIKSARELNRGSIIYMYVERDNVIHSVRITDINNESLTLGTVVTLPLNYVLNNSEFDTQLSELKSRYPYARVIPNITLNGGSARGTRRNDRKQRGGNLSDSLIMRSPLPYLSTPYPNPIQALNNVYSGGTSQVPTPPSPVAHTYTLMGAGGAPINPGLITNIGSDFSKLASPAPWQTSN